MSSDKYKIQTTLFTPYVIYSVLQCNTRHNHNAHDHDRMYTAMEKL